MNVSAARYETYSTGMPTFSLLGMRIVPARVWCYMKLTPEMPAQFDFVPAGCHFLDLLFCYSSLGERQSAGTKSNWAGISGVDLMLHQTRAGTILIPSSENIGIPVE